MWQKWNMRRGFLKIHVAADAKTKNIPSLKITDDSSHDAQLVPSLVEQAEKNDNKIVKVLADGVHMILKIISHTAIMTRKYYLQLK